MNLRKNFCLGVFILFLLVFANFGLKNEAYAATCAHNPTTSYCSPTCTSGGYTKVYCSKCGLVFSYSTTPALGHLPATVDTKVATCTEDGYTRSYCSRCGFNYSYTTTPALGHNLVTEEVPPTEFSNGYIRTYCMRCGIETSRQILLH